MTRRRTTTQRFSVRTKMQTTHGGLTYETRSAGAPSEAVLLVPLVARALGVYPEGRSERLVVGSGESRLAYGMQAISLTRPRPERRKTTRQLNRGAYSDDLWLGTQRRTPWP